MGIRRKRLTEAQTRQLWDAQGGCCAMYRSGTCTTIDGRITLDNLERDHIVPLEHGGTNELSNFQLLCASCHRAKTRDQMRARRKDHDIVMREKPPRASRKLRDSSTEAVLIQPEEDPMAMQIDF